MMMNFTYLQPTTCSLYLESDGRWKVHGPFGSKLKSSFFLMPTITYGSLESSMYVSLEGDTICMYLARWYGTIHTTYVPRGTCVDQHRGIDTSRDHRLNTGWNLHV